MSSTPSTPAPGRDLALKVLDSALVIATVVAALYFAGWTYRQSYYGRFAIDPASLGGSNVAVAVDGIDVILTITGAWLSAILPLLVAALVVLVAGHLADRVWARAHHSPFFDPLATFMAKIGVSSIAVLLIMAAGHVAGMTRAKDRLANVTHGQIWFYHLDRETIGGVTLAQTNDTTWLLTKTGVRPIKTADIRLINGPLMNHVAREH